MARAGQGQRQRAAVGVDPQRLEPGARNALPDAGQIIGRLRRAFDRKGIAHCGATHAPGAGLGQFDDQPGEIGMFARHDPGHVGQGATGRAQTQT